MFFKHIGVKVLHDGTKYDGDWIDGKANGVGIKTLTNGTVYDGHWTEGKFIKGMEFL